MTVLGKAIVIGVLAGGTLGIRAYVGRVGTPVSATAAPSPAIDVALAHQDHQARHGGLLLMNGDAHFEVTVSPDGTCRVYFTDAVRNDLPPTYASAVTIELTSRNDQRQTIPLQMDAARNVWIGQAELVDDPQTVVRVWYATVGEPPYEIDLPLSAFRGVVPSASAAPR
jgi:hypothetical protein